MLMIVPKAKVLIASILALLVLVPSIVMSQESADADESDPLGFLVGSWIGEVTGTAGVGTGEREFSIVLNGSFIHIRNKMIFESQEANPKGEVRKDWGMLSTDEDRETLVLRQFSSGGSVIQYFVDSVVDDELVIYFVSEQIENEPAGTQARLTITIHSIDEFTEVYVRTGPEEGSGERLESHWIRKQ